jgi:hypothetical protein
MIGPILSFPYQIVSSAFQTYIGLSIIATLFAYYCSTEMPREIPGETVVESPASQVQSEEETTIQDT